MSVENQFKHAVDLNNQGKYKKSFDIFSKLAVEDGHALSVLNIARMLLKGRGVKQDCEKAIGYFKILAEEPNCSKIQLEAQFALGLIHQTGEGVKQDFKTAFDYYMQAAEQGHIEAQNSLGELYHEGKGVEQNYQEAFSWWSKAADQGDANAQYYLGCMYHNGQGTEKDDDKAVEMLLKAADQGHAESLKILERSKVDD
ncbi:MAG: sel1 repeat family protein [Mesoflavibacter sp.]|nr:sel1 repeat family protein [Mesoflavibacter sp.]